MSGMPLDTAAIMSTTLEGILYGVSVLMFAGTVWTLNNRDRTQAVNRPIVVAAVLLLMLSTAHMIVDIVRTEEGLVKYRNTYPGGPPAWFADVSQPTFVMKNALYITQTILGDGVVIYRCYVVWQTIWIVIFPIVLWCASGVTGYGAVYAVSQATINATDVFAPATAQWITAFFALTLTTNILSSGLLAYRIWRIECTVTAARAAGTSSMPILRVLVDAALLYTVTLLPALITFVFSNNGQFVMIDLIVPIISIAFYMILIRIAMRQPQNGLFRGESSNDSERATSRSHAMKPLQVHISKLTHNDVTPPYQDRSSTTNKPELME